MVPAFVGRRAFRMGTALFFAGCLILSAPKAAAQEAPSQAPCKAPWIRLEFELHWDPGQRQALVEHLRAGFEIYDVHVCEAKPIVSVDPLATIQIAVSDKKNVNVSVDVHDAVTHKRIGRDVDVGGYSSEGQALAIAVAAEELVRASWAEIALKPRSKPAPADKEPEKPPPQEVQRVVHDSIDKEESPQRTQFGARTGAEVYGGAQIHVGGDVWMRHSTGERLAMSVALGPRFTFAEAAPQGTVHVRLLAGEIAAVLWLQRHRQFELALRFGLRGGLIWFEGEPRGPSSEAESQSGPLLVARTGVLAGFRIAPGLSLEASAGGGATVLGAEVTGEGQPISGATGAEAHGLFGISVDL